MRWLHVDQTAESERRRQAERRRRSLLLTELWGISIEESKRVKGRRRFVNLK